MFRINRREFDIFLLASLMAENWFPSYAAATTRKRWKYVTIKRKHYKLFILYLEPLWIIDNYPFTSNNAITVWGASWCKIKDTGHAFNSNASSIWMRKYSGFRFAGNNNNSIVRVDWRSITLTVVVTSDFLQLLCLRVLHSRKITLYFSSTTLLVYCHIACHVDSSRIWQSVHNGMGFY